MQSIDIQEGVGGRLLLPREKWETIGYIGCIGSVGEVVVLVVLVNTAY